MTDTLNKLLDGAYTKLLRYALNISWKDKITNEVLYGDLEPVSVRLRERRLIFAGHCWRSCQTAIQPVSDLLFWKVPRGTNKQGNWKPYTKILEKDTDMEVETLKHEMLNRVEWAKFIQKKCNNKIPTP
jgi:hypothetical protein